MEKEVTVWTEEERQEAEKKLAEIQTRQATMNTVAEDLVLPAGVVFHKFHDGGLEAEFLVEGGEAPISAVYNRTRSDGGYRRIPDRSLIVSLGHQATDRKRFPRRKDGGYNWEGILAWMKDLSERSVLRKENEARRDTMRETRKELFGKYTESYALWSLSNTVEVQAKAGGQFRIRECPEGFSVQYVHPIPVPFTVPTEVMASFLDRQVDPKVPQ